jgi:hypothetical protein
MMRKPAALGKVYPELQKMLDEKNAEIARIKTELMATRIDNDQLKIIINNAIRFIDGNKAYGTLDAMKKILEGGENEDGFTPNAYDDDGNPIQLGITNTVIGKPSPTTTNSPEFISGLNHEHLGREACPECPQSGYREQYLRHQRNSG